MILSAPLVEMRVYIEKDSSTYFIEARVFTDSQNRDTKEDTLPIALSNQVGPRCDW
jgi:hypothetical protein